MAIHPLSLFIYASAYETMRADTRPVTPVCEKWSPPRNMQRPSDNKSSDGEKRSFFFSLFLSLRGVSLVFMFYQCV